MVCVFSARHPNLHSSLLQTLLRPPLHQLARKQAWLSAPLLPLLLSALLCLLFAPAAHAVTVEIRSAVAAVSNVEGNADTAFPENAKTAAVRLPDEWARSLPGQGGAVWYRVQFNPPSDLEHDDLLALYIEHACSTMDVYLNGKKVHSGGRMVEPLSNNCNHPQLVTLPSGLFTRDINYIDLKLAGYRLGEVGSRQRAGGLSALLIGPQSVLAWRHARQTALQVWAPQAVSATLLLMGGFMFVLGFINRRESHLAYFGALSVGWAIIDARLWLRSVPVLHLGHSAAEFLLCAMLGFITWAAVQFLLRYARTRHRLVDVGLPVQSAVLAVSLMLAGPGRLYGLANVWYLVLALEVAVAAAWYLHHQWRTQAVWLMAVLLGTVMLAGAIEFVSQWTGTRPMVAHIGQLVVPVIFVIVGMRLVQQHGRALYQAEQGKAQLELRVREATAEIERNFRQLAELRVEQVTERERKRIAADLHDDLGAKLLTIVHTSDSERISTLAREALEEMRLSVRGLTGRPVRLADALGDWRAEVVSRLAQAGIEGDWEAPEDLPQTLSARAYVQTTRILREATSNIIKHSGATHCSVTAGINEGDFQLVVQDNGGGIAPETERRLDRGQGLASMKNRAKQLQGQCLVESGPGYGTVIRLTVPLDRALEGA
jgi:two-component system sensor histidine kinase UhpB